MNRNSDFDKCWLVVSNLFKKLEVNIYIKEKKNNNVNVITQLDICIQKT